jgi:hypothetical protein
LIKAQDEERRRGACELQDVWAVSGINSGSSPVIYCGIDNRQRQLDARNSCSGSLPSGLPKHTTRWSSYAMTDFTRYSSQRYEAEARPTVIFINQYSPTVQETSTRIVNQHHSTAAAFLHIGLYSVVGKETFLSH